MYRSAQASDRYPASRNLASTTASWRSLQHEPYCRNGSPPKSSAGQKIDVVLDGSGGLRGNHQDKWSDAGGGKTTGNKNLPFNLTHAPENKSHIFFAERTTSRKRSSHQRAKGLVSEIHTQGWESTTSAPSLCTQASHREHGNAQSNGSGMPSLTCCRGSNSDARPSIRPTAQGIPTNRT